MIYESLKYTPDSRATYSFIRNSKLFYCSKANKTKQFTVSVETMSLGSVFQTFVNHTLDYFYYAQIISS